MTDRSRRRRWTPPALWALALVVTTSWPNPGAPPVAQGDKAIHVLLYGVLGWLLARADRRVVRPWPRLVGSFLALSAFAYVDEWHQRFVPGRAQSTADWIADSVGALLGLLLGAVLRRRIPA